MATHVLPTIIREFSEQYPSISITLKEGTKVQIEDMIASNDADLAFATRLNNPGYSWIPFMEDPMVAVLPKDHPYANADSYPISAAADEAFIMPGEGGDVGRSRALCERPRRKGMHVTWVVKKGRPF